MLASRQTFFTLDPPAEQKADIDYLVASADLKTWDEHGPDDGDNRTARNKATQSMEAYYNANKSNGAADKFVVQAAYHSAKMLKSARDPKARDWCKKTIGAFEKFRGSSPTADGKNKALGSIESDMAAECAYNDIDEKIKAEFDYD